MSTTTREREAGTRLTAAGSRAGPDTWRRVGGLVLACGVFAYLVFLRTRGITTQFFLLGDQILYWSIAMRPWFEQPLGGGPSSVGGTTLGPAFLWTMWAIRATVGPFTDNLPHAGGIGISILQSAADGVLLLALWRKSRSVAFALGAVLFIGTAPFDSSLTATIWNPPVAVAFVKLAVALVLWAPGQPSAPLSAGATAAGVLAMQAHMSAVFVAVPVALASPVQALLARRWRTALACTAASVAAAALLELPLVAHLVREPSRTVASPVVAADLARTLGDPATLQVQRAFRGVVEACGHVLIGPGWERWFGVALAACLLIVTIRARRDLPLLSVTALPVVAAAIGFSIWQRGYETYWFMTVAPCAALGLWFGCASGYRRAGLTASALLAAVVLAQPARQAASMQMHRMPEYGALLRGSRQIARLAPEVREIATTFPLPPTADRDYLYRLLGGRIDPAAPLTAVIGPAGQVRFGAAPEAGASTPGPVVP